MRTAGLLTGLDGGLVPLGGYRVSALTGTMAAGIAANSWIYVFRWTDATALCVVEEILCDGLAASGTAFAAGFGKVELKIGRAMSDSGSGGTALTLTGNNTKLRTAVGGTLMGAIRIATTAALTAPTATFDSQGSAQLSAGFPAVAGQQIIAPDTPLYRKPRNGQPLILAASEGFAIRVTVPATGTWQAGITTQWSEYKING